MPFVGNIIDMASKRGSRPEDVGRRIREKRLIAHLTQEQLAAQADIKQPTLSALERGDTKNPEADTILRLAIALRCTPYYLMWDHQMPSNAHPDHERMIELWNILDSTQRAQVTAYAQALVDSGPVRPRPATQQPPKPSSQRPTRGSSGNH